MAANACMGPIGQWNCSQDVAGDVEAALDQASFVQLVAAAGACGSLFSLRAACHVWEDHEKGQVSVRRVSMENASWLAGTKLPPSCAASTIMCRDFSRADFFWKAVQAWLWYHITAMRERWK